MNRFAGMVAVTLILATAGCGSSEKDRPVGSGEVEEKITKVRITATDFAFGFDTETIPAGKIHSELVNEGVQPHQAGFYLLNEGVDFASFKKTVMEDQTQIPQLAKGGVVGVMRVTGAGESNDSIGGPLEPGVYAVMCFVRDQKTAKTHAELGMITEVEVR